jgi:hypothetical protein
VPLPPFRTASLVGDQEAALRTLPQKAGVCEFHGQGHTSLLVGRPANLQRWVASHLGRGRPPRARVRPPLDLSEVARAVTYCATRSPFEQRLVFERLLGRSVPRAARRDLKDPVYLRLDLSERFPRFLLRSGGAPGDSVYGPFRSRAGAELALKEMHKRFPLRPCDYSFEPAQDLELGLGCLYAQTRTCSAPCLVRISEDAYRDVAAAAAAFLAEPRQMPELPWIPPWVRRTGGSLGLVVVPGARVALYPVREGMVLDEGSRVVERSGLEEALANLRWEPPAGPTDDAAWLSEWLHSRRRKELYFRCDEGGASLRDAVLRATTPGFCLPPPAANDGNVD